MTLFDITYLLDERLFLFLSIRLFQIISQIIKYVYCKFYILTSMLQRFEYRTLFIDNDL